MLYKTVRYWNQNYTYYPLLKNIYSYNNVTKSAKKLKDFLSAFMKPLSRTFTLSQMPNELQVRSLMEIFLVFAGFPAAAYAAYAAGRGYSGYPSFGLPYPTGNHLSLNHLNHHNAAHIAPLNLNLNLIQAQPAPHHNPPTPTPLFYHPNLDLYNAMPLWTNSLINYTDNELSAHSNPSLHANWLCCRLVHSIPSWRESVLQRDNHEVRDSLVFPRVIRAVREHVEDTRAMRTRQLSRILEDSP